MKLQEKKCIASIKYSILDSSTKGQVERTELEHFVIAKDKSSLMRKIKAFERKFNSKSSEKSQGSYAYIKAYIKHFLSSWRNTHRLMFRI